MEEYFNNMFKKENIKLDQEQINIIKDISKYTLIIAGAGSGKTTTIAAKTKYLVDILKVNPKEILIISLTNKATNELKERINIDFDIPAPIMTFHKLSMKIIKKEHKVTVLTNPDTIISNYITKKLNNNEELLKQFLKYYILYFDNKIKNKLQTIKGEYVKTKEEKIIADILYLNNIEYKYLVYNRNNFKIKNGYIKIYNNKIFQIINKKINKNIIQINKNKDIINQLNIKLKMHTKITEQNEIYNKFIKLCIKFINDIKSRGIKIETIKTRNLDTRTRLFINLIEEVYNYYQNKLKKMNCIDFNDMITLAYEMINRDSINYKYIIVDEYQDISEERFKLLKKMVDILDANLIAVGDDWQTIFSFAGSDINLFTKFNQIFKEAKLLKITNTYRNSFELISIAETFIEKNNNQIKKQLKSPKKLKNPIIIIEYKNIEVAFNYAIKKIVEQFGTSKNILILGRYNFDKKLLKEVCYEYKKNKLIYKKNKSLDITFLSVHSSKGLGYDNVIILNMEDTEYGFPSKIIEDSIYKLINKKEEFPYSEERRLFYVALTRTKNYVYILTPTKKQSIFIKEIRKYPNIKYIKKNKL